MEYGKIIAVTGMPGLYELLSSKNDGAIVRSLEDKNTKFISSRVHNFSHLESIEVFTVRDNVNLSEIFHAMEAAEGKSPDTKDAAALKKYFEKVYPDLDFERVYSSDLKKMVKWFSVLKDNKIDIKLTPVPVEEDEQQEEPVVVESPKVKKEKVEKAAEPVKEKKAAAKAAPSAETETPKKPAVKKKAEPAKAEKAAAGKAKEPEEKKPAKKDAPKKKSK